MIEVVGHERFLTGLDGEPIGLDEHGKLWRVEMPPPKTEPSVDRERLRWVNVGSHDGRKKTLPPYPSYARKQQAASRDNALRQRA
jgi:hypothetical protein